MSRTLLVLIDENWPAQPAASWVLLDGGDQPLESGRSDLRHWPAASACEVVLSAPQCAWLQVRLPAGARREQARLLRYAVEDRIVGDVDQQHLTLIGRRAQEAGELADVLVCARALMRRVLAQLAANGRPVRRMYAELQALRAQEGRWLLASGPAGCVLQRPQAPALGLDGAAVEEVLVHLLEQARAAGQAPAAVALLQDGGADGLAPAALGARLGLPVSVEGAYAWWQARRLGADLLHGEFGSHAGSRGVVAALRRPMLLTAAALGVWLLASTAQVGWQSHQLAGLEQRMVRLFETSVPDTPAVAPALQLRRQLDEMRARHGMLRADDLLSQLDAYAEAAGAAAGGSIESLSHEGGVLRMRLGGLPADTRALLIPRLQALGHAARFDGDGQLVISPEVRP